MPRLDPPSDPSATFPYVFSLSLSAPLLTFFSLHQRLWAPLTACNVTTFEAEKEPQADRNWRVVELSFRCLVSFVKSWTGKDCALTEFSDATLNSFSRVGLIAMCADPLGLRSLVHALAINNLKLQEMTLNVVCEILRINPARGDPFRQHAQQYGDEGNKSMISDFDLVSRTR
jgi:hypothetical protein